MRGEPSTGGGREGRREETCGHGSSRMKLRVKHLTTYSGVHWLSWKIRDDKIYHYAWTEIQEVLGWKYEYQAVLAIPYRVVKTVVYTTPDVRHVCINPLQTTAKLIPH